MQVVKEYYGNVDEQAVTEFTLINDHGMLVRILDYGCTITEIVVPDRDGVYENVVLSLDSLDEYRSSSPYFGCIIGRVAGRIKDAEFELGGINYQLEKNDSGNCLHSGSSGLHQVVWAGKVVNEKNRVGVKFSYLSANGEGGFPGNLWIIVTCTLTNLNELAISYEAVSDVKTIVNLTNHSYFNLSGNIKDDIRNHWLKMESNEFAELDDEMLPTGRLIDVEGTPFDFRQWRQLIDGMRSTHRQNRLVGDGYDHPFLLKDEKKIALWDRKSGRTLKISTTEPAVIVYTSNSLEGDFSIRGVQARKYLGLCLETQALPDAVHHSHFPAIVLKKDENYHSRTVYQFGLAH
ncbi:aldose epimerase family protein [Robertmurraya massiliosenegalensis]|uniref:aldose epimerase family protein n=1 Tax=Robertmurraya TaxID=2837507 RepID=UPI0039A66C6C